MLKSMDNLELYQDIRPIKQENIELIRKRIQILSGIDKGLMSLYYIDGCSFKRIAALLEINPSNVSRRIRNITSRILAGQYIRCLQNKKYFSSQQLQVAREYYVRRKTFRQIADNTGSSFYEVRKTIERIEAIVDAAERRRTKS